MRKLKTALQSRYLIKLITITILIITLLITNLYPFKSKYIGTENTFEGKILSIQIDGDKLTVTIRTKEKLLGNYYLKTEKEKIDYQQKLKLGDTVKIEGNLNIPNKNTILNGFNYKKYLSHQKIYYIIDITKITKLKNNSSILYYIKNIIIERLNQIDNTGYITTFILGDKNKLDSETIEQYRENGISHLFSISGMHVSLITGILLYLLSKLTYNNLHKYSIITIILLFYLFLTNYTASILRTVIMFILNGINLCFNLKIKKTDIMLLVLAISCIINPFIIYNMGFQFSYIISFFLITCSNKKALYTTYICFLSGIPLCIYYYYQINLISIFLNIIMIPLVSMIIFPMTLITIFIPKLNLIYYKITVILELLNKISSKIKIFIIYFPKPSLAIVILLYIIILLSIKKPKIILLLLISLAILKASIYINSKYEITTIDVGQGDSILINTSNNKTILIDTGGKIRGEKEIWQKRKKEFSYIKNRTIPYIKSLGITKINYLILTHGDYDHMGEAINLVNNFKVEKVIFNCGEFNDLEQELIKVLDKKKIKYYSCIKELNIDKNKLYFLQTKVYDNENDNSNVIYTELNGYKFMFMGDASITTEKEILDKYNLPDIDVLKVGHHGSKTSSGKEFINEINPKYSIISVGKNNRYGHPNKEVLDNLNNSKIYRTDQYGSIMFKIKNNKLKIETCSP